MDILVKYPGLKSKLEKLSQTRRDEILNSMLETDSGYKKLTENRVHASMALKNTVAGSKESDMSFEAYSDAVYAQEIYELDAVYMQGFLDAVIYLYDNGLLN